MFVGPIVSLENKVITITPNLKQHFVNAAKGLTDVLRNSGLNAQQLQEINIKVDNQVFSLTPSNKSNNYDPKASWAGCPLIDVYDHEAVMIGTVNLTSGTFSEASHTAKA